MWFGLDLETTGLLNDQSIDPARQPGIVQIGAVVLDDKLKELRSFNSLVDPEIPIWMEGAMETHGIRPEHVKGKPSFFTIAVQIAEFAIGCTHFFGYNQKKFDAPVLGWQLKRYGREFNFPWPHTHVDVMELAMQGMRTPSKRGGMKNPKLEEAYEHYMKRKMSNAHDALADIRATADVLRKVWK
jgi:DNA polymerase-3 subunit epsilon